MKWKIPGLILGLAVCLVAFVLWPDNSSKRTLPDGTTFVLSGVKVGRTNVYVHGTLLSRTIGRLAPPKGKTIAGVRLEQPTCVTNSDFYGREMLTAEVSLSPGSPRRHDFIAPSFFRKYRLLILGDDDFAFVNEFNGFKSQPDGFFALVWARSFPRSSKTLRFRIEERDKADTRDWREVTTLVVKNPKPSEAKQWKPEQSPHLKLGDGLEVEVGDLIVKHEPVHPTDIWENLALLRVRITVGGQMDTNWGIVGGDVEDASGNFDAFTFSRAITNGWMVYRDFRPLDPAKAWKFKLHFARESDYPATNFFSFTAPWPSTSTIQTNLGAFAAKIGYVNGTTLSVELTNEPSQTRLTFVSAFDDQGTNVYGGAGSWGQHSFRRNLNLSKSTQVRVTVAIHRDYEAEFTLMPRYERAAEKIGTKSSDSPQDDK